MTTSTSEMACSRRSTCRLCGGRSLTEVIKLAPTPPANAFVPAGELGVEQPVFPLDVFFCEDCFHLQLLDIVDPRLLFENYVYVSGTSPSFVAHFRSYAERVLSRFPAAAGRLVADIGSNDGTLLRFFKEAGCDVLGIDPARRIAEDATEEGIETLNAFFTSELAAGLRRDRGPAAIVSGNNVFAHIDDLADVVTGIREWLAPDGVFCFEVSYLVDVYEKTLFDTIYHEHLDYHSVKPLVKFFAAHGMELIEAERVASHGGSLRGMTQLAGGPHPTGTSVQKAVDHEVAIGLDKPATFQQFARNIDGLREELGGLLRSLKSEGRTIAGFGAPAKATTLLYHFGIGPDLIDFIVDDSPLKQGLHTPGMHIPVLPGSAMYERKPDYVLLLAWNFAESIMMNHKAFTDAGGHFIVPLPDVRVH